MEAYEDCLVNTSTAKAPWYVIPADDKENARLIVSSIIVETLSSLPISYPESNKKHEKELHELYKQLLSE